MKPEPWWTFVGRVGLIKIGLTTGVLLAAFDGVQYFLLDEYPWTAQQIVARSLIFALLFGAATGLYIWRVQKSHAQGLLGKPAVPDPDEALARFTPRAQQVLSNSRKSADQFHHNFVGTEHILLGLIMLGQGVAFNVLLRKGLDLETVRREVEKQIGLGPDQRMVGVIPYTPRVKKVLALAAKEAQALNHTYVGTEHLLLGLLREGDGVAARVLKNLGVEMEPIRQEILKELDPNLGEPGAEGNQSAGR